MPTPLSLLENLPPPSYAIVSFTHFDYEPLLKQARRLSPTPVPEFSNHPVDYAVRFFIIEPSKDYLLTLYRQFSSWEKSRH